MKEQINLKYLLRIEFNDIFLSISQQYNVYSGIF